MDSKDPFNDFVLNELNDSSSLDDDEIFYFDVAEIVANMLVDELIRRVSIIGQWIVKGFYGTTYYIIIIFQTI
jgi:hypothetical protein